MLLIQAVILPIVLATLVLMSMLTLLVYAYSPFFINIQYRLYNVVILSAYENIQYQSIISIIGAPKEGLS